MQPIPFIQRHYSIIYESGDGFADRILLCTPKPKLLKEDEVEQWIVKLEAIGLTSLEPVYSFIHEWHSGDDDIVYTFNDEAKAVYKEFADKIVDLMNEKWEKPEQYGSIGNVSKDRRTMIRYISLSLFFFLSLSPSSLSFSLMHKIHRFTNRMCNCHCTCMSACAL